MDDSSLDVMRGIEPPNEINPNLHWHQSPRPSIEALAESLLSGDRNALSLAITLAESTLPDDQNAAIELIERVHKHRVSSRRIGITGSPGVGKSSLIERFGMRLIQDGHRVAVLAIDPSSPRTGGSILGDKSRMGALATAESAFVRPSPSSGALGGVAHRTSEAILLCEAAGFDAILIETVGVGQSEFAVADLVDCVVLLIQPGAGDELQGMKRGIMEFANVVTVTKADGANLAAARIAASQAKQALQWLGVDANGWQPSVTLASAMDEPGVDELLQACDNWFGFLMDKGLLTTRRNEQNAKWLMTSVERGLFENVVQYHSVTEMILQVSNSVKSGEVSVPRACQQVLTSLKT